MIKFREWNSVDNMLSEAINVEGFLGRIEACKTTEGLKELEKYYNKRVKEIDVPEADDIQIRDAFRGKAKDLETSDESEKDDDSESDKEEDEDI